MIRISTYKFSLTVSLTVVCLVTACVSEPPSPDSSSQAVIAEDRNATVDQAVGASKEQVATTAFYYDEKRLAEMRERGAYLVNAVASCGVCHSTVSDIPSSVSKVESGATKKVSLSGGKVFQDEWGNVVSSNITPDVKTGIGTFTVPQVMRAIRESVSKNGEPLSLVAHSGYRWMSDEDARSIATYLFSLPPVEKEITKRDVGMLSRNSWLFFPKHKEVAGYVPSLPKTETAGYGRYLALNVARCSFCHTISGQDSVSIEPRSEQFKELDRDGNPKILDRFDGGELSGKSKEKIISHLSRSPLNRNKMLCPTKGYNTMTPADKKAIAMFISKL